MAKRQPHGPRSSLADDIRAGQYVLEAVRSFGFSSRQSRIVELVLQGRSDKQIAAELGLSRHTVRTYLNRIFSRVGVEDRVSLAVVILSHPTLRCPLPTCPRNA